MIRFAPRPLLTTISADDAVLSIVAASPGHQVQGKKRIQKMTYFCTYCSVPIDARFQIHQFGVYSAEIASALDVLSLFGDLKTRDEQTGPSGYFTTVFSIGDEAIPIPEIARVVDALSGYSTPVLEVASTIAYFLNDGMSEADAIQQTKFMKPAISNVERVRLAKNLISVLADLGAADHDKRSARP